MILNRTATIQKNAGNVAASISSAAFLLSACSAQTEGVAANWNSECIGRAQISLPEPADVSAYSVPTLLSNMKIRQAQPPTSFSDGQEDGYTFLNVHGELLISHPASHTEIESLLEGKKISRMQAMQRNKAHPIDIQGNRRHFSTIDLPTHRTIGWQINEAFTAITVPGSNPILWSSSNGLNTNKEIQEKQNFLHQLLQMEPRNFGEWPSRSGLCLPYVFLPDAGTGNLKIAVTYRLRTHPDITVWLQDSRDDRDSRSAASEKSAAVDDNRIFWTLTYQARKKYLRLFLRDIKLADMDGVSSFVELTRDDDTIDYGYFASARGGAAKEPDPTNIQMFVIRDAKNALAKGIQPMGKDEFLKMAQAIAASVKKRPVSAQ
jgi:hypothetical protein